MDQEISKTSAGNIRQISQRIGLLARCTAEAKCNFRFEHDSATNTSRRVFIPPTDGQRADLIRVVRNMEARLAPAPRGVCTAILRGLSHMPVQRGTRDAADSWDNFFRQAEFDLKEFSVSHLCEASDEYRRSGKFYPTIAEIRAICVRLKDDDDRRLRRAKTALYGPENAPAARHDPPVDDRAARHTGPRDFSAIYAALARKGSAAARA